MTQPVLSAELGQYRPIEKLYPDRPTFYDKTASFFKTQAQGLLGGVQTTVTFAAGTAILNGGIHLINETGLYQLFGEDTDPIKPFGYGFSLMIGTFTASLFLVNQVVMPVFREYLRGTQPSEAKLMFVNMLAFTTTSVFSSQLAGKVLSPFTNSQVGNTELFGSAFMSFRSQLANYVKKETEAKKEKTEDNSNPDSPASS